MNGYGILLLHGLFGTPGDFGELPEILRAMRFNVSAPLLIGHKSPEYLRRIKAQDFFHFAEEKYRYLVKQCPKGIILIGHSLGSSLAMHLANKFPKQTKGLVVLSSPYRLNVFERTLLALLRYLPWAFPTNPNTKNFADQVAAKKHESHKKYYLSTLCEYMKVLERVAPIIGDIKVPSLVIYSRCDNVIEFLDSCIIYQELPPDKKYFLALEIGKHLILKDSDKTITIERIKQFIRKLTEN